MARGRLYSRKGILPVPVKNIGIGTVFYIYAMVVGPEKA